MFSLFSVVCVILIRSFLRTFVKLLRALDPVWQDWEFNLHLARRRRLIPVPPDYRPDPASRSNHRRPVYLKH